MGEKRFKELRVRLMDGKINLSTVMKDAKFSPEDRKALFKIEEILEYKSRGL